MDPLAPGNVLLGKYRVEELIGTGGMGRVVRAAHLYLQQPVAIKVLLREMADSQSTVQRFLREAQATVSLKSEHIARVIDVATLHDGTPVMVMEYLTGNDLNQILRHHGPQAPSIMCDLVLQACEGIAEAHSLGIVHRDIKPSNFFITQRPDGSMLLKILDFGISKTPVGVSELTGTQTVLGTPTYMAPEQMRSGRGAEARSDIWSIGVVMYQMLTGRPPFDGDSYAALVLQVNGEPPAPIQVPLPPGLADVIMKCLEKDPRNRQQNVGELARTLAPYATDPIAAALSAARTARILAHKPGVPQSLPLGPGGGLTTPVPLSPAQLTPPSQTSLSSLSQTAGQMTFQTRSNRGWIIAGVATLVVLAGAGGFVASTMMKSDDEPARRDEPYVQAPAPAAAPAAVPAPPPPPPAAAVTATVPPVSPTFPAETDAKTEVKTEVKKAEPEPTKAEPEPRKAEPEPRKAEPEPKKPEPKKPEVKADPPRPPEVKKPPPAKPPEVKKPPPAKPPKSDDIFNSRK